MTSLPDRQDSLQRVTIRDVARVAGVHPATVSRALHPTQRTLIRPETVARVEAAAAQLGYRPNSVARALRTSRSGLVGTIIPDLTNPLFSAMVRGIENRLQDADAITVAVSTDGDVERERRAIEALRARQVDGLIVATAAEGDSALQEAYQQLGLPVVLMNRALPGSQLSWVVPDDRRGAALAVEHLAGLGHERIAHIAGPMNLSAGRWRCESFRETARRLGVTDVVVDARAFTVEQGLHAARRLLRAKEPPSAVFAANDLIALGTYTALQELGLRCPHDVSVVGFNDMPFADRFAPPLTTVHVPQAEIGRRAAELLLERLHDPARATARIVVESRLVVRGSTASPAARP